jgi:methyltransferase (TIGR00027 family)
MIPFCRVSLKSCNRPATCRQCLKERVKPLTVRARQISGSLDWCERGASFGIGIGIGLPALLLRQYSSPLDRYVTLGGIPMDEKGPSQTAIRTAMRRAAHYLLDDDPKVLADAFARSFAGFSNDQDLLTALRAAPLGNVPWMRTPYVIRNRYAEDELANAVSRGIAQYVILGAGLDSFAYRCPDSMGHVNIFEVDHPASQSWKRQRVAELGITVPRTLHYIPIDFETQTLTEGLTTGGLNRVAPTFFSWLGVTQYLTPEAVLQTLGEIVEVSAKGSQLVVQFIAPPETLAEDEAELVHSLATGSAKVGEPWLSYFEPQQLAEHLQRLGFHAIRHFGPAEAATRYLANRTDGMRLPAYFRMIVAEAG